MSFVNQVATSYSVVSCFCGNPPPHLPPAKEGKLLVLKGSQGCAGTGAGQAGVALWEGRSWVRAATLHFLSPLYLSASNHRIVESQGYSLATEGPGLFCSPYSLPAAWFSLGTRGSQRRENR